MIVTKHTKLTSRDHYEHLNLKKIGFFKEVFITLFYHKQIKILLLCCLALTILLGACTRQKPPLGSSDNPIKFVLLPSADTKLLAQKAVFIQRYLELKTSYKYKFSIPTNYIATVEAFGTKRADIAYMNTIGYIMAHKYFKVEARLTSERYGLTLIRHKLLQKLMGLSNHLLILRAKHLPMLIPYQLQDILYLLNYLRTSRSSLVKQFLLKDMTM